MRKNVNYIIENNFIKSSENKGILDDLFNKKLALIIINFEDNLK